MKWLTHSFIAHRGLHSTNVCENSLGAFEEAIIHNYAIELDIQFTKDKQVIVFHDNNTRRLTGINANVHKSVYAQINHLKLQKTDDTIPLLTDVLTHVNGKTPLLIEIKNENEVGEFEQKVADILDDYNGAFAIHSFNVQTLVWFKHNRPDFLRGLVYGDERPSSVYVVLKFIFSYLKSKPHFVSLDYFLLDSFIVKLCKQAQIPLLCWTINSKTKAKKALTLVDNLIFEKIRL